jgi:formate dehydrogenase subunit beta
MAKSVTLPVENGQIRKAVNAFLQDLLNKKVVEAVLVPIKHPADNNIVQTLVTRPEFLAQADVFAPVLPVISARIVSAMTRITPADRRTAVVMRPCEMRALIELVKLRQAQLDDLLLIGIDCPGAYPLDDYLAYADKNTSDDFVRASAKRGAEDEARLRAGCRICASPSPMTADLVIGLTGLDTGKALLLQAETAIGEEVLGKLGLTAETDSPAAQQRRAAIEKAGEAIKETKEILRGHR